MSSDAADVAAGNANEPEGFRLGALPTCGWTGMSAPPARQQRDGELARLLILMQRMMVGQAFLPARRAQLRPRRHSEQLPVAPLPR